MTCHNDIVSILQAISWIMIILHQYDTS